MSTKGSDKWELARGVCTVLLAAVLFFPSLELVFVKSPGWKELGGSSLHQPPSVKQSSLNNFILKAPGVRLSGQR